MFNLLKTFGLSKEEKIPQKQKITAFSGDESEQIVNFSSAFLGKTLSEQPPKLMIYMGGIGSGKTTMRRQDRNEYYVNLDFGDMRVAAKNFFGEQHPRLFDYIKVAGDFILEQALNQRKNITIEVSPYDLDIFDKILIKMKEKGYKIILKELDCEVQEGYKRHKKAAKEDPDYISSYHTQPDLFGTFIRYFDSQS